MNNDYIIIKADDQTWEEATISYNIYGFIVASLPPTARPKQRVQITEVDGRDGDIITNLGWSAYDKQMRVGLYGDYDVNEVLNFFKPKGQVIFSDEPDRYFDYEIINPIELERVIQFKKGTVTFHVQPYQYAVGTKSVNIETQTTITDSQFLAGGQGDIGDDSAWVSITAPNYSRLLSFMIDLPYTGNKFSPWKTIMCSVFRGGNHIHSSLLTFPTTYSTGIPIPEDELFYGGQYDALTGDLYYTIDRWGNDVDIRYAKRERLYPIGVDFQLSSEVLTNIYVYKILVDEDNQDNGQSDYPMPTFTVSYYSNATEDMIVTNIGNVDAQPIITVHGSGAVTLYNNGKSMCQMDITDYLTVDAEQMSAYRGNVSKNRYFTGDFDDIKLTVGNNTITWTGIVSQIDITYRPRWI